MGGIRLPPWLGAPHSTCHRALRDQPSGRTPAAVTSSRYAMTSLCPPIRAQPNAVSSARLALSCRRQPPRDVGLVRGSRDTRTDAADRPAIAVARVLARTRRGRALVPLAR